MRVVINKCFGGFSLSPAALLWLYKHGFRANATLAKDYYNESGELTAKLRKWRKYRKTGKRGGFAPVVFSPDEKLVLTNNLGCRSEPLLVECVKALKEKANGDHAKLKIVEIPDDVEYTIEEYDGQEHIAEKHRTWD